MATEVPNVTFIRYELRRVFDLYEMIRDCLGGSKQVKNKRQKYLPVPNEEDASPANLSRYNAYLKRAHFLAATRRTLAGLVGEVFARDPVVKIPDLLKPMLQDVNGASLNFNQQAKKALQYVLAYSRFGGMVDFPRVDGQATKLQVDSGEVRPLIRIFSPWQIINWREATLNSKTFFTLVVISETYLNEDDGFEVKHAGQIRVLRLDASGNYVQDIWRERIATNFDEDKLKPVGSYTQLVETISMIGADGQPLKEILFSFCGAENNDSAVDYPNLADLADTNLAHYRNSADYEEAVFMTGQPTPAITGLTKQWVDEVLKGKVVLGSRSAVMLPVGGDMKLVVAEENSMMAEAMEGKQQMMTALGAKLIEQRDVQRTATEASQDNAQDTSVLSTCANNVSAFYTWAFTKAGELMSVTEKSDVKLNNDFDINALTPEQQQQLIAQWQAGAIDYEEMRKGLKRAGTAFKDDAEAKAAAETDAKNKNNEAIRVAQNSKPPTIPAK